MPVGPAYDKKHILRQNFWNILIGWAPVNAFLEKFWPSIVTRQDEIWKLHNLDGTIETLLIILLIILLQYQ